MGDLTSGGQATTFFTVVGSQDPQITPGGVQGPALDLLDALLTAGERVTEVMLAWTPDQGNRQWPGGYDAQRDALECEVRSRLPGVQVQSLPVRVRPNAAAEVLPVLAGALERFRHAGRLLVNTSSGTPQMLEALKVLRGTGWFADGDVTLWQVDRPEFRVPGQAFWRRRPRPSWRRHCGWERRSRRCAGSISRVRVMRSRRWRRARWNCPAGAGPCLTLNTWRTPCGGWMHGTR
ncbi:hypothetical protein [Deinococcus aquaticus]|uniref:hypothetical protein n=1 Tax=Deinococcus aquaticus TaxID=328692 RepID=UPI003622EFF9